MSFLFPFLASKTCVASSTAPSMPAMKVRSSNVQTSTRSMPALERATLRKMGIP